MVRLGKNGATQGAQKIGNYMRKCESGGLSLANAERGVGMCGFADKIDTEFVITNVLFPKFSSWSLIPASFGRCFHSIS